MATIINAFSVPIITAQLEDCGELNRGLRELFVDCARQGNRYANPEPFTHRSEQLFESAFNLFQWRQPLVEKMRDFCLSTLYHSIGEVCGHGTGALQKLHVAHESWFHVTRKGGYFGVHNHPMHSWSGVYCVCQEGDEGNEDSGRLTFINPFVGNHMYVDMANHQFKPPFQTGNIPVRLKPGQLVLFPSWLLHEVSAFQPADDNGLRITVAFNCRFRMDGVHPHSAFS